MSTSFLLLWTCGPVQDFIASARKGRDLWFGSWLLSEVSTAAARALLQAGGELILPAPANLHALEAPDYDVPNRVLALMTGLAPLEAASLATDAARKRLADLAQAVFGQVPTGRDDRPLFDRAEAEQQVADLLEFAWATTDVTAEERSDRRRVEGLLAARKSLRPFAAPSFASWHVPKSSLDGQREAVTRKGAGLRIGLTHDERLCGPGLLKRYGHTALSKAQAPGGNVASVSTFALLSWLRPAIDADRPRLEESIEDFEECLRHKLGDLVERDAFRAPTQPLFGTLDPHAFFESRLMEFMMPEPDGQPGATEEHTRRLAHAQRAHASAMKAFVDGLNDWVEDGRHIPQQPTPYYAVLVGDGDHMGALLDQLDHAGVQAVSAVLADFAQTVRAHVLSPDRLEGACIYAGGDDVLAFVPVDVALKKARELYEAFAAGFDQALQGGTLAPIRQSPTFSVGVGVAHHLTPLRDALRAGKTAERNAKDKGGRAAWALRVDKRSGGALDLWGKWADGSDRQLIKLAEASGASGSTEGDRPRIPRGLAHDLRSSSVRLDPAAWRDDTKSAASDAVERCELQRILDQKLGYSRDTGDPVRNKLAQDLLIQEFQQRGLRQLAKRLVIARTLSGMGGMA